MGSGMIGKPYAVSHESGAHGHRHFKLHARLCAHSPLRVNPSEARNWRQGSFSPNSLVSGQKRLHTQQSSSSLVSSLAALPASIGVRLPSQHARLPACPAPTADRQACCLPAPCSRAKALLLTVAHCGAATPEVSQSAAHTPIAFSGVEVEERSSNSLQLLSPSFPGDSDGAGG